MPIIDVFSQGKPVSCPSFGNPIYPLQGIKREEFAVGVSVGHQSLKLVFDSRAKIPTSVPMPPGVAHPSTIKPPSLGSLWYSNLHKKIKVQANGAALQADRGDGNIRSMMLDLGGRYLPDDDSNDYVQQVTSGYRYYDSQNGVAEVYDGAGVLQQSYSINGGRLDYKYSTSVTSTTIAPSPGYLIEVQDERGRSIKLGYSLPAGSNPASGGLLTSVTDPSTNVTAFAYDATGNLKTVTWPDGKAKTFMYENVGLPWALTGILDENGSRFSTFAYDSSGRANATSRAGGVDAYAVTHVTAPSLQVYEVLDAAKEIIYRHHEWIPPQGTSITGPQGSSNSITSGNILDRPYLLTQSQPAGSGCAASTSSLEYDASGNITSKVDFNGNRSCFSIDPIRNLPIVTVEGLAASATCSSVIASASVLPSEARKYTESWHPSWELQTELSGPKNLKTWIYNGQPDPTNNNTIANCASAAAPLPDGTVLPLLCKLVEQSTLDSSGGRGLDVIGAGGIPVDPAFASVKLLLHFDGVNGSTNIADSSSAARIPSKINQTAVLDTSGPVFGSGASRFAGGQIWYADSPDWDVGAGDFTIEMWAKFNVESTGSRVFLFGKAAADGSQNTITLGKDTLDRLVAYFNTSSGSYSILDTTPIQSSSWYHIAITRSGSTFKLWKNGIEAGSVAVAGSSLPNANSFVVGSIGEYLGAYGGPYGTMMMGWLDEFRFTKGLARYTAPFAPATSPFGTAVAVPPVGSGIDVAASVRVYSWTYDAFGQVLTKKDPLGNLTSYSYYADNTIDHSIGDLKSVTNAAGHVTQYTIYDLSGRLKRSIDPNGVTTDVGYSPRGWVNSVTVTPPAGAGAAQTTSFVYDGVGQLKEATLPDATKITYSYDAAHRLTGLKDGAGNTITYTLDNLGNRTGEAFKDSAGNLVRNLTRVIDALGRVQSVTGARP